MAEIKIAAESGHWYEKDGTPRYTLIGANGKERNTTLRDARKMNLFPSVTTVIACAAQPQLEKWKRNQVLMAALTLPRNDGESEVEWIARVEEDWQQEGRAAAERGTQIHAAVEQSFRGETPAADLIPFVLAATAKLPPATQFTPERSFACLSGYGGKTDLCAIDGSWLIDVKTKDGDLPDSIYDSHVMQLAAYRAGMGMHFARCGILYVARDRPEATLVEAAEESLQQGGSMFNALLLYWQAKNKYKPQ